MEHYWQPKCCRKCPDKKMMCSEICSKPMIEAEENDRAIKEQSAEIAKRDARIKELEAKVEEHRRGSIWNPKNLYGDIRKRSPEAPADKKGV